MLSLEEQKEFAFDYARKKRFRTWYDTAVAWIDRNEASAELCATKGTKQYNADRTEFYLKFRLSDSRGAFFAAIFPLRQLRDETEDGFHRRIERECSRAVAFARKDRIEALTGRPAAAKVA